ncbi:phosphoglycerate dehydrogenase [Nakamurella silvestris]|nr:phosphoglycerate dehydrogenase [Nakamurella silvestris]
MTTTVLVADAATAGQLRDLPDITLLTLGEDHALPPGAEAAQVYVPGFLAGAAAVEVIAKLPALELIQLQTAGAEVWLSHVPTGVTLCTARGAHGGSTAEWSIGAIIASLRMFPFFRDTQQQGRWERRVTDELAGKRVLVIGSGDLGTEMARKLEPFDVTTTMCARTARPGVHGINEVMDLLPEHDIVVLMVPLTEDTTHLVDATFLAAMPDGSLLVNAARGPVVDTDALLAELRSERLHAALDVTDPEPLPDGHALFSAPGLLLTPHVAGSVPGALHRSTTVVRRQLGLFAAGSPLENVVSAEGY